MEILNIILIAVLFIGVICIFLGFVSILNPEVNGQLPYDQYNTQNFQQDQFQNQQYQQPYQDQYNQGFNTQFQQPFNQYPQQYGMNTQYGTPYQQPYYPQQQGYGGLPIGEIIAALIGGGSGVAYARRRSNKLEDDNQILYGEALKAKQRDADIVRFASQLNPSVANEINDAPNVKLENLNKDIESFTNKTAKA